MKKMTGYQIQREDGMNAFNSDPHQVFKTFGEAVEWARVMMEEEEETRDFIIAEYYHGEPVYRWYMERREK